MATFDRWVVKQTVNAFPGTRKIKRRVKKLVPARTEVVKVYCTCRLPDDGHKMVECYQCKEW